MKNLTDKIKAYVKEQCHQSTSVEDWFFSEHLEVVNKFAIELLAQQPTADKEVVTLAVWLHDGQRIFNLDGEHALAGAEKSREILQEFGVTDERLLAGVYETIKTHRAKEYPPVTIESKILATADALSHCSGNFYLRVYFSKMKKGEFENIAEFKQWVRAKINRDYRDKIFFDAARKLVVREYKTLMDFFGMD
jgi:HD superfamily phosphohydrolase YqeK